MADITKYNGQKYKFKLELRNEKGKLKLNPVSIRAFSINENFFEPFADAVITISNPYNYLEGKDDWFMRGDGTDILEYEFEPEKQGKQANSK